MDKLENAKINFNLLNEFQGAKKIGTGAYRVNPCPKCGGNDHFTVYEPNSSKNKNSWWTYSSYNNCCSGGSPIDYLIEFKGLSKEEAIKQLTRDMTSSSIKNKSIVADPKDTLVKTYDFTLLAEKLHSNKEGLEYYKRRGLTHTIDSYKLGFASGGYNEALKDYPEVNISHTNNKAYKYFIPLFDKDGKVVSFIARHDNSINEKQKTWNLKGLEQRLFNQRYLECPLNNSFIYICEGWADALSLEEINKKAIALNSVQMASRFIKTVEANINILRNKTFIIALDSDIAGVEATNKIKEGLNKLKIKYYDILLPDGIHDINDYLVSDRRGFTSFIKGVEDKVTENLLQFTNGSSLFASVLSEIENNYNNGGLKNISTGFQELDKKIGGGIYNGLYVIGAGSSIGKTTFVQQIADFIASHGKKVLFFSLEMGKNEMISKTIVRELYLKNRDFNIGSRQLLNGDLTETDITTLCLDSNRIGKLVENIYYLEGNFGTTIKDIVNKTNEFKNIFGEAPVIVVDYLQAIAPVDYKIGDKQSVDMNISELKRLSRDLETPVIAISSINRQNYLSYIDFTAFKESGSIEYGADVVIGLQLNAIHKISELKDTKINEKREIYNQAKAATPREIELVILKNRYGSSTGTHNYKYYPKFNLFEEMDDAFEEVSVTDNQEALSLFE